LDNTGKAIAEQIRAELKEEVASLKSSTGVTPGLAVVLVGDRTDSATYVRMKRKACEEVSLSGGGGGGGSSSSSGSIALLHLNCPFPDQPPALSPPLCSPPLPSSLSMR